MDKYYTDKEGINWPFESIVSSRKHSWITDSEIGNEYPEFIEKIVDILSDDGYPDKMKNYAKSIITFLSDFKWVSWKQFDSIFRIYNFKENGFKHYYKGDVLIVENGKLITVRKNRLSFTYRSDNNTKLGLMIKYSNSDRDMDKIHENIFGHRPMFEEEEEGFSVSYRRDGSRFFSFPTGEERLCDYI